MLGLVTLFETSDGVFPLYVGSILNGTAVKRSPEKVG